jgi:hypothetical protein
MMVIRRLGGRGSPCWAVGKPPRARTWHTCWGCTALPSAAGWRSRPLRAGTRSWPPTCLLANPSPSPQRGWRAASRPSGVRKASPRMRQYAAGSGRRTGWRARTRRALPSCARAAGPSAQGRAPATHKTPQAMPACQATWRERLERAMPPDNRRPVRVCRQDDSRVGLLPVRRRRFTAGGVQPVGAVQHVCAWFDVDGAVAPTTGEPVCVERPSRHADLCQCFSEAFAPASRTAYIAGSWITAAPIRPHACAGPSMSGTCGCPPTVRS